jgi:LysM repeat protein/Tfp pilus assembly protein PilZ
MKSAIGLTKVDNTERSGSCSVSVREVRDLAANDVFRQRRFRVFKPTRRPHRGIYWGHRDSAPIHRRERLLPYSNRAESGDHLQPVSPCDAAETQPMSAPVKPLGPADKPNRPVDPSLIEAADDGSVAVAELDRRGPESRRMFPRIPCRVLVDYVVGGAAYRDCIANISEGGAFIETSKALEPGSLITLSFSLFQDQQPIKVVGEVAWAGPTGVGVRFRQNQAIGHFSSQPGESAPPPLGSEEESQAVPKPWRRRASDVGPRRAPVKPVTTAPLWVALTLIVVLAMVSRYETNARIDAVADRVDRAAQSLVRLQSIAMARAADSSHTTLVQSAPEPAQPASAAPPVPAPVRVEPPPPHVEPAAAAATPQEQPSAARVIPTDTPPTSDTTYVVREGDNLYRIARMYNVPYTALREYNGLNQPNRILVGQRIRIPK